MKPLNKILLIVLGVAGLSLAIITAYSYFKSKKEALSYQFDGKADTVIYSHKGEPTITIHGTKYDLSVNFWDFNHQIQVGDSLVKKRNSLQVKIFKSDGTIIIKQ